VNPRSGATIPGPRSEPPPLSGEPPERWSIRTGDGWTLTLRTYPLPPGRPAKAAVLLSHGMMLSGQAMDRPVGQGLVSFLRSSGFLPTTVDLRGHGSSLPHASRRVDWCFDDFVREDLPSALRAVKALAPGLPLIYLGHSLSAHAGAVAVGLTPDLEVDALVLLCPGPWLRSFEPSRLLWWSKRALLPVWSAIATLCGRFPAAFLRVGTDDESRGFVDQHRDWASRGWVSRDRRTDYHAALAQLRAPTLVVGAGGDLLCRSGAVERFAAAVDGATYWRVDRARLASRRHPGHMGVLNATRAGRLWGDLAVWIESQLPKAPGAATSA
jgi:predicted alpha/beta hydrolase